MRERDELIEELATLMRPADAERLVDAYAHALAERIRKEIKDPSPLASLFQPFAGTLAANLIDPKEER